MFQEFPFHGIFTEPDVCVVRRGPSSHEQEDINEESAFQCKGGGIQYMKGLRSTFTEKGNSVKRSGPINDRQTLETESFCPHALPTSQLLIHHTCFRHYQALG